MDQGSDSSPRKLSERCSESQQFSQGGRCIFGGLRRAPKQNLARVRAAFVLGGSHGADDVDTGGVTQPGQRWAAALQVMGYCGPQPVGLPRAESVNRVTR